MARNGYDVAQICLNGHIINNSSTDNPEYNEKYCKKCGAETITQCQQCGEQIRGHLRGVFPSINQPPPSFCINCGQPYPWTISRLEAARQLTEELEILDDDEKETLNESIKNLVSDTPMTTVSVGRFKKLMKKVGPAMAGMFRDILVSVITETAKSQIWG